MQQEPDSWEIVTEIDPLNVGEILGSIGGFWGGFHRGPTFESVIFCVMPTADKMQNIGVLPRVDAAISSCWGMIAVRVTDSEAFS